MFVIVERIFWLIASRERPPGKSLEIGQADFLAIQHREAIWWRDACLAYFQTFSKRPFPSGYAPKYPLDYYQHMPMFASPAP